MAANGVWNTKHWRMTCRAFLPLSSLACYCGSGSFSHAEIRLQKTIVSAGKCRQSGWLLACVFFGGFIDGVVYLQSDDDFFPVRLAVDHFTHKRDSPPIHLCQ